MIKAKFHIATTEGKLEVSGYKPDASSMIGAHRDNESDPWTVTFLSTGTKIDSLFPQRFQGLAKLMRAITFVETEALVSWLSLLDLPWAAQKFDSDHAEAVAAIRAASARAL